MNPLATAWVVITRGNGTARHARPASRRRRLRGEVQKIRRAGDVHGMPVDREEDRWSHRSGTVRGLRRNAAPHSTGRNF